eukprot:CAMPEP_0116893660 /NCGR_PEP_ID=MMETSP0467-20121206/3600_1 /TAXON_ID=283647 /ORGANISM="Mesodinium pulex, Strain SPMC105" /LENGTH=180 /DNA_ID=CAMNT_0004563445 /DNA_START=920 /DNA_END=1461 /DNA_ORIENTATION=+
MITAGPPGSSTPLISTRVCPLQSACPNSVCYSTTGTSGPGGGGFTLALEFGPEVGRQLVDFVLLDALLFVAIAYVAHFGVTQHLQKEHDFVPVDLAVAVESAATEFEVLVQREDGVQTPTFDAHAGQRGDEVVAYEHEEEGEVVHNPLDVLSSLDFTVELQLELVADQVDVSQTELFAEL